MAKRAKLDFAEEFQYFMDMCETDPNRAGTEYLAKLKAAKPNKDIMLTIKNLGQILADPDDNSAWHHSARNFKQAIQFVIQHTIFKANNLGVIPPPRGRYGKPGMESIVANVANMITEDINFDPMTPQQKRIKQIAESYGYSVYLLTENQSDNPLPPPPGFPPPSIRTASRNFHAASRIQHTPDS